MIVATFIATFIILMIYWIPQGQVAKVEPDQEVNKVVEQAVEEHITWSESQGRVVSKKLLTKENQTSYEVVIRLDVLGESVTMPISGIEYIVLREGDMIDVLYIYNSVEEALKHVQLVRNHEGQLTIDIDQPIVVIDPGHGGGDYGEGSNDYWTEKEFNLDISKAMAKELESKGIRTIMTRETDDYINLYDRCAVANYVGADMFVSNHLNRMDGAASGIEVLYSSQAEKVFAVSLAESMASEEHVVYRVYNRKASDQLITDFYFVHKYTHAPSYIIEYGFSDNEKDTAYILEHWEEMVKQASDTIEAVLRD